jgi:hypothetical protein
MLTFGRTPFVKIKKRLKKTLLLRLRWMIVMDSVEDDTVGVKTLNLVDVLSEIKKKQRSVIIFC